ncbi:peptide/nickel transport system substrate-binding protein [Shimia aestuarii]|uniref:Peptide/nickel transport system substrate-binding protein n=2 Tax=Shimia aestuarii TaxID=254406 RepID=A0A1I4KKW9_9RHOB|nr:peptide/nickel transport system substrate-binding protein [Shimia aestuarii]
MSRISRRSLLTSGAAAGVLAASGMALMAAPRAGGTLRAAVAGGSPLDSWDSRTHSGLFMLVAAHGAVFDCLTEVGPDGALRGELAESWEASADARIWTFNLRKGVEFHNGKRFGAEDVLESLALHMGPGNASPAAPLLANVSELRKVHEHQVQFHLSAPNADFPYLMADYHLIIYPAGYVELAMENGIGTGLFRLENFEPGKRLSARRVASHYKGTSAGFFAEIELINENGDQTRLDALGRGHVDVASQIAPSLARQVEGWDAVELQRIAGNQHFSFAMNASVSPFDRADLRRAVKFGIDRNVFVEAVLHGHGRVAHDTPIGPSNQYYATDLEPIHHDPDLARHYLRKAGVDRVAMTSTGYAFADAELAGGLVRDQLRSIGLDVSMTDMHNTAALTMGGSSGRVTEDWAFSTYYADGASWNTSDWQHPLFQNLLLTARSELDGKRRRAHYTDMQQLLRDEGPVAIPAFADHLFATRDTIRRPATMGNVWSLDNARLAERWWHA